jgi:3-phenylpropionate/cinnamic acid dioxygenase small subunit
MPESLAAITESLGRLLVKEDVEAFLYREAELLDERRYEEWLDLFTDDCHYFMPMRRNVPHDAPEREFTREGRDVNWFDEGKDTLTRRVRQILTGIHWAEEPPSRRRRRGRGQKRSRSSAAS